jgi:hypothetical protein
VDLVLAAITKCLYDALNPVKVTLDVAVPTVVVFNAT